MRVSRASRVMSWRMLRAEPMDLSIRSITALRLWASTSSTWPAIDGIPFHRPGGRRYRRPGRWLLYRFESCFYYASARGFRKDRSWGNETTDQGSAHAGHRHLLLGHDIRGDQAPGEERAPAAAGGPPIPDRGGAAGSSVSSQMRASR